jgi:hypothetical protein
MQFLPGQRIISKQFNTLSSLKFNKRYFCQEISKPLQMQFQQLLQQQNNIDSEILWKPIICSHFDWDFPNYAISNEGNVMNLQTQKILKISQSQQMALRNKEKKINQTISRNRLVNNT